MSRGKSTYERFAALFAAFALVTGAAIFWCRRILLGADAVGFSGADLDNAIYPGSVLLAESWRAGRLPLWNPYQAAGAPMLAATPDLGAFYPLNAWLLVLPAEWAIEAIVVTHLALAGLGTYAFARALGLRRSASVLAGTVYMLSGFMAGQAISYPPGLSSAAWLPFSLLGCEWIRGGRTRAGIGTLAAATALAILAGSVQYAVYTTYAVALYMVYRFVFGQGALRTRVSPIVATAAAVMLGVAAAAVQILPTLEIPVLQSRLVEGLAVKDLLPHGVRVPESYTAAMTDPRPGLPRREYLGIVTLVLAAVGLVTRRSTVVFFASLGAAAMTVGLATSTRFFAFFLLLPGATWFPFPDRGVGFLHAFAAAMLAALGVDALPGVQSKSRRILYTGAVVWVAAWLLLDATLTTEHLWLMASVSVAVLALPRMGPGALRNATLAACILLAGADLYLAQHATAVRPSRAMDSFRAHETALAYLREHQGFARTHFQAPARTRFHPPLMARQATLAHLFTISDYARHTSDRQERVWERLCSPISYPPRFPGLCELLPHSVNSPLFDTFSVRFVAVPASDAPSELRRNLEADPWSHARSVAGESDDGPAHDVAIYEHRDPLPRAYIADHATVVQSDADALAAVTAADFDPRATVVIESTAQSEAASATLTPIRPATITSYGEGEVVVEAEASVPGYLVLTDSADPAWTATVDGEARPILTANYLFRAVALEPGRHEVRFVYTSAGLAPGAMITLAAAFLIGWLMLGLRRRNDRRTAA